MEVMETMTGDVLNINNIYRSYSDYKRALDGELQRSAESFVRIGYLLKVARDTDILQESGYSSVNDFAHAEYGLDKSQVSRFIRINDEFSKNGYSDRLQERYQSFGYAKLSLMLLLPDEINEELSASYSKAEIQAVKEEIDEEKRTTDLEVMLEEKDERQQACGIFGKVLYQIGKDNPEIYPGLYDAVCNTVYDGTSQPVVEKLMDVLAPAGEAIISVRIAGEGRKMLSVKGADMDPVLVDIRSGDKQSCTWDQLIEELEALCPDAEDARKAWEILYGEAFPEKKQEVAPVQPRKESESHRTGRVVKAKKPKKTREETVSVESEKAMPTAGQQETVEQPAEEPEMKEQEAAGVKEGPEKLEKTQEKTAEAAGAEDTAIADSDGMKRHIESQKGIIIDKLKTMQRWCEQNDWDEIINAAEEIVTRVESIKNMEAVWEV